MMNILSIFKWRSRSQKIADAVKEGAVVIDVRTPAEFKQGHIKGSMNIPLDKIASKASELGKKNRTIITTCRSGARSGSAAAILRSKGLSAINGGAWTSLRNEI